MDVAHIAIMVLSVVAGLLVRRLVRVERPTSRPVSATLGLAAVLGGVIGAKLPFLFTDLTALKSFDIWWSDGRTVTWALGGGYLAVELCKLALGVTAKTGDGFAAPVAMSIAIGRLGCFQGGCCYGIETTLPWAVDFGDGIHRHPTQLYETAFHGTAVLVLLALQRWNLQRTQHFKLYLGSYCVYRFATEWIRPEPPGLFHLTFYQVSVLVMLLAMVTHYLLDARA